MGGPMGCLFVILIVVAVVSVFAIAVAIIASVLTWFLYRWDKKETEACQLENEKTYWQKRDEMEAGSK